MKERISILAVVVLALSGLAPVASAQTPVPTASDSAAGEREPSIVYQWLGSVGHDAILVACSDGSDAHDLVKGSIPGINQYHPDWSPDGALITFVNENFGAKDIWLADASGENARLLYDSPAEMPWVDHPAFSPDGTRIVAASYDLEPTYDVASRTALILIDASTGEAEEISVLDGQHRHYAYPRWSPDGDALVVSIGLYDDADGQWIGEAIGVLHQTGAGWSEPELLTDFDAFASYPDWSPDGDRIVFATQDRGWFLYTMTNHGKSVDWGDATPDLYTIDPGGSDLTKITDTARDGGDYGQPSWTPDGRIVFTYDNLDGEYPNRSTGFLNSDGSGLEFLDNEATHSRLRGPSGC